MIFKGALLNLVRNGDYILLSQEKKENLTGLKIGLSFAMFFVVLIICGLPIVIVHILSKRRSSVSETNTPGLFLDSNSRFKIWCSRISCLAAGVFLTTGFMDIFPDVQESVEESLIALGRKIDYPLASLFALIGFFLILSVERIVASKNVEQSEDRHSFFKTISLVAALSLHSVFEGLAVGLEQTYTKTLTIFFALLLHKVIIALSMGINLATLHSSLQSGAISGKKTTITQMASTLMFAIASPIGLFVGLAMLNSESSGSGSMLMVTAILQGFACGTFFFVVFCEILPDEFGFEARDQITKLVFLVVGFIIIAIFMIFVHD